MNPLFQVTFPSQGSHTAYSVMEICLSSVGWFQSTCTCIWASIFM